MPIESAVASGAMSRSRSESRANPRESPPRFLAERCDRHEPEQVETGRARARARRARGTSAGCTPPRCGSSVRLSCRKMPRCRSAPPGAKRVDERLAVDRVDHVGVLAHLPRLLALQLADEVPGEARGRRARRPSAAPPGGGSRRSRDAPSAASSRTSDAGWNLVTTIVGDRRRGRGRLARAASTMPARTVSSRSPSSRRCARDTALLQEVGDVQVVVVVVEAAVDGSGGTRLGSRGPRLGLGERRRVASGVAVASGAT